MLQTLDKKRQLQLYHFYFKDLMLRSDRLLKITKFSELTRTIVEALSRTECIKKLIKFEVEWTTKVDVDQDFDMVIGIVNQCE